MIRTTLPALLLATLLDPGPASLQGQGPIRGSRPSAKPVAPGEVPGYTRQVIEGFTVLVSKEAASADATGFEKKPAEVLEQELKLVVAALPKKHLEFVRSIPVWVEWDEKVALPNIREGFATAVYYGGSQQSLLPDGKNSPRFRAVTVLSLAKLTAIHQPQNDFPGSILLHEFAHAVHDQRVGRDTAAAIGTAYRQALERKLYDRNLYVASNESEFFAELSSAYFDRLAYFPRNRAELKKHDPVTFRILDGIWQAPARPETPTLPDNGAKKFDLGVAITDVALGEVLAGKPLTEEEATGKIVVVMFWHPRDPTVLTRAAQLTEELGGFGVRVVAVSTDPTTEVDRPKREMDRRGVSFTAVASATITERSKNRFTIPPAPHALVFDGTGSCIFRGSGYDAAAHARAAIVRKPLASLTIPEKSRDLAKILESLRAGEPFPEVLAALLPVTKSPDPPTAKAAKSVQELLHAPTIAALEAARKSRKTDPVATFLTAEKIAASHKGSPVGGKAGELVAELRADPAVANELRARKLFETVAKLDAILAARLGTADPTAGRFFFENADTLKNLRQTVEKMQKLHPNARATAEAERIAANYGIR